MSGLQVLSVSFLFLFCFPECIIRNHVSYHISPVTSLNKSEAIRCLVITQFSTSIYLFFEKNSIWSMLFFKYLTNTTAVNCLVITQSSTWIACRYSWHDHSIDNYNTRDILNQKMTNTLPIGFSPSRQENQYCPILLQNAFLMWDGLDE